MGCCTTMTGWNVVNWWCAREPKYELAFCSCTCSTGRGSKTRKNYSCGNIGICKSECLWKSRRMCWVRKRCFSLVCCLVNFWWFVISQKNLSRIPLRKNMKCLCESEDPNIGWLSRYAKDFACFVSKMLSGGSDHWDLKCTLVWRWMGTAVHVCML